MHSRVVKNLGHDPNRVLEKIGRDLIIDIFETWEPIRRTRLDLALVTQPQLVFNKK